MPTINDAATRTAIAARLDRLGADTPPLWGKFTAPRMVVHLTDSMRMATGELPVKPKNVPLARMFPLKHLILYVLPFPKSTPTAPELIAREPGALADEVAALKAMLERWGTATSGTVAAHPVFGALSQSEWGTLGARHIDHHLRQFGV